METQYGVHSNEIRRKTLYGIRSCSCEWTESCRVAHAVGNCNKYLIKPELPGL